MPVPKVTPRPREVKLFWNNRSQAVRIPVEFQMPGDRVLIRRDGEKLVLEPVKTPSTLKELLMAWREEPQLRPEDDFPDIQDVAATPEDIL
ncbi:MULTISPECIES: antitoxin [Acetobacter]|uniref:Nitrogen regulatory protein NtrP n=2 Tax=Acetobacter TaxID=434 RepID=A0A401WYT9_ACEPA|nr:MULTISPECIES: AbrB/MazE/SpoVT family DNA-binding domain-containing protein [Acetobacter]KDE19179.1 nitrogen regulatory protein [Acetobacter aceti 1023]MCG4255376.1 AbrB/MazE/SpoVT family DNA-binding domain-containing protein [Acetobacter senegalensis]MCG4274749.1 AbrB/MazE/SpoVT family DNA-binding domain-containing protein [Acetobacter senegalensis]MCP1247067.1 AbrB/MazE/SpoVT family DNA-binding domain-containing protein [Acetobacter cerevisiae]MCP1256620.1 AbrB/MazE/SpoVT family DNA-bindin